ncbi:MAG: efflux RND transporter periplasmic adaptor subunit [Planctomycetota bacterium]
MAKRKGSGLKYLVFFGVLAGGAYGAHRAGWTDQLLAKDEVKLIEGAPVRRGDLRVSEVVRGNLEAKNSVVLRSQLEGRSTIIFLAEEGTRVEAGDLVAELDVSQVDDERVRQEIAVQQAELEVTKAEKQVEIQVIQNRTDLAAAALEVELAELDLKKYGDEENGDWVLELAKAQESVTIKDEEYKRADNELVWTEKLAEEGFIQKSQLDADRLSKQRAAIELEQVKRELASKIAYGTKRKLAELNAEVENRKSLLEKTEKQAEAKMADYTAALTSATYKLEREREKLTKIRDQIGKAKLFAPEAGLVVYAREQGRMGSTEVIDEGQEVRERQEIISIPRAGGMVVKASIHETKLKKIRTTMPCLITVDAFPNRVFNGTVDFVAVMADSGSWRSNPNTRLYKAEIGLSDGISEMRPGMSCNVEILIDDLKDVLYVPRQCVLLDGGETIVFLQQGDDAVRRKVEVGLDNSKWVVIKSGVTEGDVVLLAPPANFDPAPAPEQEVDPAIAAAAAAAAANGAPVMPSGGARRAGRRPASTRAACAARAARAQARASTRAACAAALAMARAVARGPRPAAQVTRRPGPRRAAAAVGAATEAPAVAPKALAAPRAPAVARLPGTVRAGRVDAAAPRARAALPPRAEAATSDGGGPYRAVAAPFDPGHASRRRARRRPTRLSHGRPGRARPRGRLVHLPPGRVLGDHGQLRQRQVHAAEHPRLHRPADRRRVQGPRPRHERARR